MADGRVCYTIGHSTHDIETFLGLLESHRIDALVDVRSVPYSRFASHFNKEPLTHLLKAAGVAYLYFGDSLGARYDAPSLLHENGCVDFSKVMRTQTFIRAIVRIENGLAQGRRIALMCSEKEPFDCHRFALVGRALNRRGVEIRHIVPEGLVSQRDLEERLFEKYKLARHNLLQSEEEALEEAYLRRNLDIGYNAITKEGDEI